MPTLRIPFPETGEPVTVSLRGPRITIGRLADNVVQLRDRTVSAHHAEFVEEGDHYRVHDLGATNALLVDGNPVTDFHLREACKIAFGGVECEFDPASTGADEDPARRLISAAERAEIAQEIATLRRKADVLQDEADKLRRTHAEAEGAKVPQAEFDRVVGECRASIEAVAERDREIARLKGELAVMRRERDTLQRALDESRPKTAPTPVATPAEVQPKAAEPKFDPNLSKPVFVRSAPAAPPMPVKPAPASPPSAAPRAKPPIPLAAVSSGNGKPSAAPLKKTQRIA